MFCIEAVVTRNEGVPMVRTGRPVALRAISDQRPATSQQQPSSRVPVRAHTVRSRPKSEGVRFEQAAMTQTASERGDWRGVIADRGAPAGEPRPRGMAALWGGAAADDPTRPGCGQAAAAGSPRIVQAQKEGATAEAVSEAQRHSVLISLQEALTLAGMASSAAALRL